MKQLRCIAPDGAFVTEKYFNTIDEAWDHSSDMGSRWIFYPIHVVTGKKKILAVPDGMSDWWVGKNFSTLCKSIAENSDEVCDWLNGECPCPILP